PGAAAILADWGAEVIKLEPPDGDPMRAMFHQAAGINADINPPFELDNRGKRSISVNLQHSDGKRIADQLLHNADVFVTNVRGSALKRFGLDYDRVHLAN